MEKAEGKKLSKFIKSKYQENTFCIESLTAKLISSLLHAVKYMHDNFIVHRDIKPDNLFINSN